MKRFFSFLVLVSIGTYSLAVPAYSATSNSNNLSASTSKEHSIDITPSFSSDVKELFVDETGVIEIEDIYGVKLEGEFQPEKNDFIELKADGTFTALKDTSGIEDIRGDGVITLAPQFKISQKSLTEIKKAYLETPGNESINPDEITFSTREILQYIQIKIKDKDSKSPIEISLMPKEEKIVAKVGEKGRLTLADYEGIPLKGTFKAVTDNPLIKLDSQGEWEALTIGQTSFAAEVTLTADTIDTLKKAFPNREIQYLTPTSNLIEVTVISPNPKEPITLTLAPKESEIIATVGDKGQLTLGDYEGIPLEGTFAEVTDNPQIKLDKQGQWEALAAGDTSFIASITLTEATLTKLAEAFPGREIRFAEIAPQINVSISPKKDATTNSGPSDKKKNLPQTGEEVSALGITLGLLISTLSVTFIYLKSNGN